MIASLLLAVDSKVCREVDWAERAPASTAGWSLSSDISSAGGRELLVIAVEGTKRVSPSHLRCNSASFSETEISPRWTGRVMLLKA